MRKKILTDILEKIKLEIMEKVVTITLTKENYNCDEPVSILPVGSKVGFGLPIPKQLKQRIKNRQMLARLYRKTWKPYLQVTELDGTRPYQHTFTLKPFNF